MFNKELNRRIDNLEEQLKKVEWKINMMVDYTEGKDYSEVPVNNSIQAILDYLGLPLKVQYTQEKIIVMNKNASQS